MIKEVILFAAGDPQAAKTWSNVPAMMYNTLKSKGIKVHGVSFAPENIICTLGAYFNKVLRLMFRGCVYDFSRTSLYRYLCNSRIRKAIEKYPNADCCIFMTFSYYNKFSNIPSVLFCDWTYDVLLNERIGRKPYFFEKWPLKQEREAVTSSQYVFSLFPSCAQSIRSYYKSDHIYYIGGGLVNILYDKPLDEVDIVNRKNHSNIVLFIGNGGYKDAAKSLIEAHKLCKNTSPFELHIVGMTESDLGSHEGVICHGYLNKDNESERNLYYDLMKSARFVANPTPIWGGYSSIVEAMYFYNPVLVSPYKDFVEEFGKTIDFGIYNERFTAECIADNIQKFFFCEDYPALCHCAHDTVKDFTWDKRVDYLLSIIANNKNKYNCHRNALNF